MMKCPVCFATIDPIPGEMIHVCPYCDAILIPGEKGYSTIDKKPWWIKKTEDLRGSTGILVTENHTFIFNYRERWILNEKFELEYKSNENIDKNEKVTYIYGALPVFTYPGMSISTVIDDKIKIYHQKGLTVFKPI